MAGLNLNFSDQYKTVPAGNYPIVVESAEVVEAKKPNDDGTTAYNLLMEFRIMDGPQEDETLRQWASLKQANLWSLRNTLINLGVPLHEMMDDDGNVLIETDAEDPDEDPCGTLLNPQIVGLTGIAVITEGTYNGRTTSNINKILDNQGVDREKALREERKAERNGGPVRSRPSTPAEQTPVAASNGAAPRKNLTLRRTSTT